MSADFPHAVHTAEKAYQHTTHATSSARLEDAPGCFDSMAEEEEVGKIGPRAQV